LLHVILIVIFILILLNQKVDAEKSSLILINEVMSSPIQSDFYNEWIELFNPNPYPIDVGNWTIDDGDDADYILGNADHGNGTTIIPGNSYAIITDHGTEIYENLNISAEVVKLYVEDSAICGYGLNNNQEKLVLSDESGTIIDSIEWGYDYKDISGFPAYSVNKGNTIARYPNKNENNSILDFYFGITPTPGSKNIIDLDIELYPKYISKIPKNYDYSLPFAFKVSLNKFASNESYQLKSYLIGNISNIWPSSQTWNGLSWRYSNEYTSKILPNNNGSWTGWQFLRFNKDYQDYILNIQNNSKAYLSIKFKNNDSLFVVTKKVYLLDIDDSTTNGVKGGYLVGRAKFNENFLDNKSILVENKVGEVIGCYITEDNGIDDELIIKKGYYKIPLPVGSGYKIKIYNITGLIHLFENRDVKPGSYRNEITCFETSYFVRRNESIDIPIIVKNVGDLSDAINISIISENENWNITIEKHVLFLNPKEMSIIFIHVIPSNDQFSNICNITICTTSKNDIGESDDIRISLNILAPDLTITNVKSLDNYGVNKTKFHKGQMITIKSNIKNKGNENATNVSISYYYDIIDKNHLIGKKEYSSIGKYHKYPSILWDTSNIMEGEHEIIVFIDSDNEIEELNELNNKFSIEIEIFTDNTNTVDILITEVYYYTHSKIDNEYISLYNPSSMTIDISGWFITNSPRKNIKEQAKIIFPEKTLLPPNNNILITQNSSAYQYETGKTADFEYSVNSSIDIPDMIKYKNLRLSNNGGAVALKNQFNETKDIIVYGEIDSVNKGWMGLPVNNSGMGNILKRNRNEQGKYVDSNTYYDWVNPRIFGIGQSDFPYIHLSVNGEIKTFVSPDCAYQILVSEIRNATKLIYFNIYEFTNPYLCYELIDALKRNVSVYIYLEGSPIGGIDDREKYILRILKNNGAKIRFIVNDQKNKIHARYIFNHGKYLIIDNTTIIVESCNWVKTGVPIDPSFGNREWGIVVKNQIVAEYFLKIFMDDWNPNRCDSYSFEKLDLTVPSGFYLDDSICKGSYKPIFNSLKYCGNFTAIPVFSPDTSYKAICNLIDSADDCIYIEQLYVYKDWKNNLSPFIKKLINKSTQGIDIRIILNYNPSYEATIEKCNQTKCFLEEYGIKVKFIYTNWSYFTNVHNKGMIVDNKSVLISSINWNENSVTRNREAGIIIENEFISSFYADVFLYDWQLNPPQVKETGFYLVDYKNQLLIVLIYGFTFAIIARDWRKRRWT